ncbi:MAG: RNA polymerase sigma factor [Blastocatellia bacterium]
MSDEEMFDRFLSWLDPDREEAGKKYEVIRQKLIRIFTYRGCSDVEELADITIKRVVRKIQEIIDSYVGDPALYFYGVARNVCKERCKRKPLPTPPPATENSSEEKELRHDCLEKCLDKLAPEDRKMILSYYEGDKTAKIDGRKEMAERLGLNSNALRIRMHRIRTTLQKCMLGCLKEKATG